MAQLFGGLVLAAITSLCFIAYRHPKEFQTIGAILSIIAFLLFSALEIWNFSAENATFGLYSILESKDANGYPIDPSDKVKKIQDKIRSQEFYPDYLIFAFLGTNAFLMLLLNLPTLGIVDKNAHQKPEEPKPKKSKKVPPE